MPDSTEVYLLLKEIFFLIDDGDRNFLSRFDLTISRYYAMRHIQQEPGISPLELSDRMFCDKSNISRIVKSMESDGLVSRKRHESDRRSYRLYLTDTGESVCENAVQAHDQYNALRFRQSTLLEEKSAWCSLMQLKENLLAELHQRA